MKLFAISTGGIIAVIIVAVIIFALIIWGVSTRNKFVRLRNNVEESFSTIDISLKKRWDLIPNLVETVKGYASHEKGTLESVIAARNMAMTATNPQEKIAAENALSGTLRSIFALTESYPNLKADVQFVNLQNQLTNIETELAQHRKYYNATVKAFNNALEIFPSNIIAGMMKLEKKPFFEIEEAQRQNVTVKF